MLKNGADPGPFIVYSQSGNPFSSSGDEFVWDIRDSDGTWHLAQRRIDAAFAAGVFDVRYPHGGINGWERSLDDTLYKDW
jgi:hypothetical protein